MEDQVQILVKTGILNDLQEKNIFRWKQVWIKDYCMCPITGDETLLKIKDEIVSIENGDPVEVMLYEDHKNILRH